MKTFLRIGIVLVCIASITGLPGETLAAKKIKAYNSQTTGTFVNEEGVSSYGLVVSLSSSGEVVLDDQNLAGPFRDVSGNGTQTLHFSNPTKPVTATGDADAQVTLKFQSYSKDLRVKGFYWTDLAGKRIGKKKKL